MGALSSMNIFLKQEVDRMNRIIAVVRTSLSDLKLAIDGTIIMSEVRAPKMATTRTTTADNAIFMLNFRSVKQPFLMLKRLGESYKIKAIAGVLTRQKEIKVVEP